MASGSFPRANDIDTLISPNNLHAALSLVCATVAWTVDHAVLGAVFAALGVATTLNAAPWHRSLI
jgi:hypothetical protein